LAAGVVVYAAAAGERLRVVVIGVGSAGCLLAALAFPRRWATLLPLGLVGVGGCYGLFVALQGGSVDAAAPIVAATLYAAAELGYWSLERGARYRRVIVARRLGGVALGALAAALVGSLVLVAASGVSGGVALEALGVAAALLTLGAIALLASRASV
jgi:hypothetical protein